VSEALWALIGFPQPPRCWATKEFFRQRYRLPDERYGDHRLPARLKARVGPLRSAAAEKPDKSIISDLPEAGNSQRMGGARSEQSKL